MRSSNPTTTSAIAEALYRIMAPLHHTWMAEAERTLEPMTRRDSSFWERWAAVTYLENRMLDRVELDSAFLAELRSAGSPHLSGQLTTQLHNLLRLHREVLALSRQCPPISQLAGAIRHLLEALRLWYAEIERAADAIARQGITRPGDAGLDRLRLGYA